ncbi:hypothetical protein V6N13_033951 [Hibiscus sabdariffa]
MPQAEGRTTSMSLPSLFCKLCTSQTPSRGFQDSRGSKKVASVQLPRASRRVYYRCRAPGQMVKDYSISNDVTLVQSQRLTPSQRGRSFARGRARELS